LRSLRQTGGQGLVVTALRQALLVALIGVGLVIPHADAHAPVMTDKQKRQMVVKNMEPKEFARYLVNQRWNNSQSQFGCLAQLWGKESAWNYKAKSPTHDYGIPQRHMKHNTAQQIKDFMKDHKVQIRWGLNYIEHRYESPCGALKSWLSRADKNGRGGWY